MEFNFVLPKDFKSQSVAHLLEQTWLVPRKQRYFLRMKKHFLVNDRAVSDDEMLVSADRIKIIFDEEDFPLLEVNFGDEKLAEILYEDEHLVIANKPEGMKTHGNTKDEFALQNHVAARLNQPVYVVHRLDEATSGAVLFAKNQFVLPILGRMFENNEIHREYVALVHGHFQQKKLTINQPIGRDRHDKRKQIVSKTGKMALTHLSVLTAFRQHSLLALSLDTGRTHQIRVHLQAIGHPILGDLLYGKKEHEPRLMLHARQIVLRQPFSEQILEILAPSQSFDARCKQEEDNENQRNRR